MSSAHSDKFQAAFDFVVGAEGGYVNDPDDPGGETKWGVSKRQYPHLDIKNLTKENAMCIYYGDYWQPCHCDEIHPYLATAVFDCAVNQGPKVAIRLLQGTYKVVADGIWGPNTANVAASATKEHVAIYLALRAMRYVDTDGYGKYGKGWFKRLFLNALETQL